MLLLLLLPNKKEDEGNEFGKKKYFRRSMPATMMPTIMSRMELEDRSSLRAPLLRASSAKYVALLLKYGTSMANMHMVCFDTI